MLLLRPRPSLLHCSFCREEVEQSEDTACSECGVLLHRECWPELRRCPTPGCTRPARHRVRLRRRPRRVEREHLLPLPARVLTRIGGLLVTAFVLGVGISLAGELTRGRLWDSLGLAIQGPFVVFAIWVHSWFRELASAREVEGQAVARGRYVPRRRR